MKTIPREDMLEMHDHAMRHPWREGEPLPPPHCCGLRVAYADPPYIGQAKARYSHDPKCAEVDHRALIDHLNTFDAWALSLSSPTLKQILALCPDGVRVCAWVKPFCAYKPNVNPAYAWEPVIVRGGRRRTRQQETVTDWVSANITLKRGLCGVKPEAFCYWLFGMMNLRRGDDFHDLYPGSGAVTRAWKKWENQTTLFSHNREIERKEVR